jgi:hypothetical protein
MAIGTYVKYFCSAGAWCYVDTDLHNRTHLNELELVVGFTSFFLLFRFSNKDFVCNSDLSCICYIPSQSILIYQPNNIWGKRITTTYLQNGQYVLILEEILIFLPDSSQSFRRKILIPSSGPK